MKRATARKIPVEPEIVLRPGRWLMRNGHTAIITHQKVLSYQSGSKDKVFPIWVGRCEECSAPCTWNNNGTYAAVGRHQNDILGAA